MLLVPLTVKQIHSMQNMQAHAPEMKAIQRKYKGDRQKLNEELMKFYKENNINPAASCLPMLAQFPVFIGLFFVLKDFEKEIIRRPTSRPLGWLHLVPDITDNGERALVGLSCCSSSTRQPARVDVLHVHDDGQDAALPDDGPADRLHPVHRSTSRPGSSSTG